MNNMCFESLAELETIYWYLEGLVEYSAVTFSTTWARNRKDQSKELGVVADSDSQARMIE